MSDKGDFLSPLREMPQRVHDVFADPVRRRHVLSRIAETAVPATPLFLLLGAGWWTPAFDVVLVLGELALYEFVLEPAGLTGHYWERGPRDGETFKIG